MMKGTTDNKPAEAENDAYDMPTMRLGTPRPAGTAASIDDYDQPTMREVAPQSSGPKVGDKLVGGRYEILSELGRGGMGVVYKCFDNVAGIEVAVKALPPELSHNQDEMEEVRDNFQLVSRLFHPNIAAYRTLERDDQTGDYYLVMELVMGESLRQWVKRMRKDKGGISLDDALPILRQVADALDYAHGMMVMHRDIKPANVMLTSDGQTKVMDFGLAAQIHSSLSHVSMAYSGTSGTQSYMSPEQWRGRPQGAAADQYALAVMAYEMLAGRLPFESSDTDVLKKAVLEEKAAPIDVLPASANRALRRALAKEPQERFASCMDFVDALSGMRVRLSSSGKSYSRRLVAGLVLVALLAGVFFYMRQESFQKKALPANIPLGENPQNAAQKLIEEAEDGKNREKRDTQLAEAKTAVDSHERKEVQRQEHGGSNPNDNNAEARKQHTDAALSVAAQNAHDAQERETATRTDEKGLDTEPGNAETQKLKKDAEAGQMKQQNNALHVNNAEQQLEGSKDASVTQPTNQGFPYQLDLDGVSLKMIAVEPGRFLMGSPKNQSEGYNNETQHWVTLTKSFWLGETEVTQGQWKAVMGSKPYRKEGDTYPMVDVSWDDAMEFCKRLNRKFAGQLPSGYAFSLPTEAQWEFAARGGNKSSGYRYSGSDSCEDVAWFWGNADDKIHPVKGKKCNELGFYDMSGNVWEWCSDSYDSDYGCNNSAVTDPQGGGNDSKRGVIRGGGRTYGPSSCRVARRFEKLKSGCDGTVGFRLALVFVQPQTSNTAPKQPLATERIVNAERQQEGTKEASVTQPTKQGFPYQLDLDGVSLTMIKVKAGRFQMGSPNGESGRGQDETLHWVTLTRDYWLGETEVTWGQWKAVMGKNPSKSHKGDDYPVENVSWDDAMTFCKRIRTYP